MSAKADLPDLATGITLSIDATPLGVRRALGMLMQALERLELGADETGTVELVLAEVLNNAVEHAYAGKGGRIELSCRHAPNGLHVTLRDRGIAMPDSQIPAGTENRLRPGSDRPDGGFGWLIIRNLARDIAYRRDGGENVLIFRLAVGRDHAMH